MLTFRRHLNEDPFSIVSICFRQSVQIRPKTFLILTKLTSIKPVSVRFIPGKGFELVTLSRDNLDFKNGVDHGIFFRLHSIIIIVANQWQIGSGINLIMKKHR